MNTAHGTMDFMSHLEELRTRVIRCLLAVLLGFAICYSFSESLFELLMRPVLDALPKGKDALHFTSLIEPFMTYLKVGVLAGFFGASPVVFYQLWSFIGPGLYAHEKKMVIPFVLASTFFFVGGALFGYFVVFPIGFKFFISFTSDSIQPMLTISDYLGLATKLLLGFGAIFELPLILFFLCLVGIIDVDTLVSKWRYAVVAIFIISAVLTPADVASMILMAVPLLVLYFLTILVTRFFLGKKKHPSS